MANGSLGAGVRARELKYLILTLVVRCDVFFCIYWTFRPSFGLSSAM